MTCKTHGTETPPVQFYLLTKSLEDNEYSGNYPFTNKHHCVLLVWLIRATHWDYSVEQADVITFITERDIYLLDKMPSLMRRNKVHCLVGRESYFLKKQTISSFQGEKCDNDNKTE